MEGVVGDGAAAVPGAAGRGSGVMGSVGVPGMVGVLGTVAGASSKEKEPEGTIENETDWGKLMEPLGVPGIGEGERPEFQPAAVQGSAPRSFRKSLRFRPWKGD
jgi:hypothetical protein